ncbi:MAG: tetratricopeptide repeat protein [Bacteroidales bacterium]|jgi:tetratricopeptide (TPR) repeat protein|nr:tetratricopeptide repeat protein [Bacteroidales bacterium]
MDSRSSDTQFNEALRLEKQCDLDGAMNAYMELLRKDPDYRNAYINLGSLYSRLNKLQEAMQCYRAALTLGSDYITHFNMGCIYYKIGKYSNALDYLAKSFDMNKAFYLSLLVSGLCYSRLNKLQNAEESFLQVLQLAPGNRVALTALAIIYYNTSRYDRSLALLDRIVTLDNEAITPRELKSDILLKLGRIDESAKITKEIAARSDGYRYFEEYIKSIPVEIFSDRYGTMDEKISSLQVKIHTDTENLIALSLCHLLKGDTETAIDYLYKYKKKPAN